MELVITVGEAPALFYLFSLTLRLQRNELEKRGSYSIYTADKSHSCSVGDAAIFKFVCVKSKHSCVRLQNATIGVIF